MSWKELYRLFLSELATVYPAGEASAITERLFEWKEGTGRLNLIMNENKVTENVMEQYRKYLSSLLDQMPVQYVTGETWFYGYKFRISPEVLIPRPETEELVQMALDFSASKAHLNVLDIGTGSGCIAISIKKKRIDFSVTATDLSPGAIRIARLNANELNTEISFIEGDFLSGKFPQESYDIIISNPPYIPDQEKQSMDKNVVAYEPHMALFVPADDPLIFYRQISIYAKKNLNEKGKIFVETHEDLAGEVSELFKTAGFSSETVKDMFGKERFCTAIHCP